MPLLLNFPIVKQSHFGRLVHLLKKNPRYMLSVGPVFFVVPSFAAITIYHKLHDSDVILSRSNPEPWNKKWRPKF